MIRSSVFIKHPILRILRIAAVALTGVPLCGILVLFCVGSVRRIILPVLPGGAYRHSARGRDNREVNMTRADQKRVMKKTSNQLTVNARADAFQVDFERLPKPFFGRHKAWSDLADFAWKRAAAHVRKSRGRWHMGVAWGPTCNYQWVWDAVFMTLYCRYGNGQYPGIQSLDNFYELQREDGYIGMTYDMTTGEEPWPNRINPPLFAWAEWEHYRTTNDDSRFERVLPHIERLMAWIDDNRRNAPHRRARARAKEHLESEAGSYRLYYFEDCGSSGMDNAPRTPRSPEAGRFFDWIDLSSQMALSFRTLGRMHAVRGTSDRAAHWENRARELGKLINDELWCAQTRFYHDRTLPLNFVSAKTVAGFWPLLAGICPRSRIAALVDHLRDPRVFDRPFPVPALAADDPNYDPRGTYWNGGVWAPTNYVITRGLMRSGEGDEAHRIAVKYLNGLVKTFDSVKPHTLWESYAPESFRPGLTAYTGELVKPDFVGWTGLGPIAMLIENVIGIDLDAPARRLTWDIRLTEEHGVEKLGYGGGHVTVRCARRAGLSAPAHVELCSDTDLSVVIRCGDRCRRSRICAGKILTLTV